MRRLVPLLLCFASLAPIGCKTSSSRPRPLPPRAFATQGGAMLELAGKMLTVRSEARRRPK